MMRPYFIQMSLPGLDPIQESVDYLALAEEEERGAIFTRREVVSFILDLMGYTPDAPLCSFRILEPSFGAGDFLHVIVERLFSSLEKGDEASVGQLKDCIRAVELHKETFVETREQVRDQLRGYGVNDRAVERLVEAWLIQADFLFKDFPFAFNFVAGNPPYVRQESIPDVLLKEYRRRFTTLYDRADLYVPFIEKSLNHLAPKGVLGFICSDRWMKNRYGGPLRQRISESFHLKYSVDMVDTPAFTSEVAAYPAITVITRDKPGVTRIACRPEIDEKVLRSLADDLRNGNGTARVVDGIVQGAEPWMLDSLEQLRFVRRLEKTCPTLEEVGCHVGIGVATGADKVFIASFDALDVEQTCKLPLVMTKDIQDGIVQWHGLSVINPFSEEGTLVDLDAHPRLAAYLHKHEEVIRNRNVAKRNPKSWYRTIDRIYPELAATPKLLIPDIKGKPHVVYESGRFYPHHNLYYVISDTWDLKALQAVLRSGIARLFVSMYSTRMRGGYFRYQAQYLRRIRIPRWEDVSRPLREKLILAAGEQTIDACNECVSELYDLSIDERLLLLGHSEGE